MHVCSIRTSVYENFCTKQFRFLSCVANFPLEYTCWNMSIKNLPACEKAIFHFSWRRETSGKIFKKYLLYQEKDFKKYKTTYSESSCSQLLCVPSRMRGIAVYAEACQVHQRRLRIRWAGWHNSRDLSKLQSVGLYLLSCPWRVHQDCAPALLAVHFHFLVYGKDVFKSFIFLYLSECQTLISPSQILL